LDLLEKLRQMAPVKIGFFKYRQKTKIKLAANFAALLNHCASFKKFIHHTCSVPLRSKIVRKSKSILCMALLIGSMQPVFAGVNISNLSSSTFSEV